MRYHIESLAERGTESLLHIMESSFRVRSRSEYGLWTQTQLGAVLTHDIMVSVATGRPMPIVHVEKAIEVPFSHEQIAAMFCADGGLMAPLIASWKTHKRPYLRNAGNGDLGKETRTGATVFIRRYGLGNIAAHGVEDLGGEVITFFCFARVREQLGPYQAYLLEMIVPHLNVVFTRAIAGNTALLASEHPDRHHQLTAREKEIMHWVKEGKSNWETAMILDISELTVKNHLHNILRKLSAQSRSHAVAKAIRLKII